MTTTPIRSLAAAVLLTATAAIAAAEDEPLPVPAEDLVFCTVCHGVQLMGNDILKAPRLSGLSPWYVENQLEAFRAAAFVGETRSPAPEHTVEGDAQRGERLYTSCAACHALDGSGNEALGAPALTGQNDWYLVHQLENYREGRRGYAEEDVYGRQMQASVALLADDEAIRDVVKYITTLPSH